MSRRSWVALTLSAWVASALSACASHPSVSNHRGRNCVTDFRHVLTVKQPYPQGRPELCVLVRSRHGIGMQR
jgi:hypothetical protein